MERLQRIRASQPGGEVGQHEAVGAVDAEVAAYERGQPCQVLVQYRVALGPELADGCVEVDGGPQHHAVEHQAEGAELVLQAALVALVQLALLPVADLPGQGVAAFLQVADALDVAPVGLVGVDVAEDVQGLEDPPVHRDGLAERGGVAIALEHGDHVVSADGAGVDRGDTRSMSSQFRLIFAVSTRPRAKAFSGP
jgi:hypothetical protein